MSDFSPSWEKILRKFRVHIAVEKNLAENTVEAYMRDVEQFAAFCSQADRPVAPDGVDRQTVEQYMSTLFDRHLEPRSQARMLSSLRSLFNYMMLNDLIDRSPLRADVVRGMLPASEALLYLCGLAGVCAVNYIVFSVATLYYIGYPLFIAYAAFALRAYLRRYGRLYRKSQ